MNAVLEALRERIIDLISKHPEKAVTILTAWIKEAPKKGKKAA